MSWFTNLEKNIAGKLHKAFTSAKELADHASDEVAKAEEALVAAKKKAADLSAEAHAAAVAAVEKAKAETEALIAAAEEAARKAEYHASLVPAPQEPVVPTLEPVVEETPIVTGTPEVTEPAPVVAQPVCNLCKTSPCSCGQTTPQ